MTSFSMDPPKGPYVSPGAMLDFEAYGPFGHALLKAWSGGDQEALGELTPKVYFELHRMAANYMRKENSGNTLQTTALVHEAFLQSPPQ